MHIIPGSFVERNSVAAKQNGSDAPNSCPRTKTVTADLGGDGYRLPSGESSSALSREERDYGE